AVEYLRRPMNPTQRLGNGRVVQVAQAWSMARIVDVHVPQPGFPRLALQLQHDGRHSPRVVGVVPELLFVAPFVGVDMLVEKLLYARQPLLPARAAVKVHVKSLYAAVPDKS